MDPKKQELNQNAYRGDRRFATSAGSLPIAQAVDSAYRPIGDSITPASMDRLDPGAPRSMRSGDPSPARSAPRIAGGSDVLDWDKLRIFHAAAEVGSFTHAGDSLGLSQSAVSRQVSALEHELQVPLFHRHARGLILTEQGEVLIRTVRELVQKLEQTRVRLIDSHERPHGELRVTTTLGIGTSWLAPRLGEFVELYPDIHVNVILSDTELDLAMREADVGLRTREPVQPDLIRRKLFTLHFHAYASASYLKRHGQPRIPDDLDRHRILSYGASAASYLNNINWLQTVGRDPKKPRPAALTINNISALREAVESGIGIAVLPDYLVTGNTSLVRLQTPTEMQEFDCYLVYPEELKSVARVQVFRDFLVANAQRWDF
jgi:DNA-binding transcriptional LysR family regulator